MALDNARMHVTWITSGTIDKRADGRLTSPMASVRYRVLYVAEQLLANGHRVDIIQGGVPANADYLEAPLDADVVIISKGLFEGSVAIAERAKQRGARVLMDICDDHFDTVFRETYLALCALADGITASTPAMARVIAERTTRDAAVIGDPYEAPHGSPRFQPSEILRLLWFGHPSNFDTLAAMMPSLIDFSRQRPVELHVVSENVANIAGSLEQLHRRHGPQLAARFTPWSQDATWQALAACDAVVIPSLPTDVKLVKSPNRIVDSIRSGRFVAAYPLPSYGAFASCAWLGENVLDGIRWALENSQEALTRIRCGQQLVADRCDAKVLAAEWESLIQRYAASRPPSCVSPVRASQLHGSIASARV